MLDTTGLREAAVILLNNYHAWGAIRQLPPEADKFCCRYISSCHMRTAIHPPLVFDPRRRIVRILEGLAEVVSASLILSGLVLNLSSPLKCEGLDIVFE